SHCFRPVGAGRTIAQFAHFSSPQSSFLLTAWHFFWTILASVGFRETPRQSWSSGCSSTPFQAVCFAIECFYEGQFIALFVLRFLTVTHFCTTLWKGYYQSHLAWCVSLHSIVRLEIL